MRFFKSNLSGVDRGYEIYMEPLHYIIEDRCSFPPCAADDEFADGSRGTLRSETSHVIQLGALDHLQLSNSFDSFPTSPVRRFSIKQLINTTTCWQNTATSLRYPAT